MKGPQYSQVPHKQVCRYDTQHSFYCVRSCWISLSINGALIYHQICLFHFCTCWMVCVLVQRLLVMYLMPWRHGDSRGLWITFLRIISLAQSTIFSTGLKQSLKRVAQNIVGTFAVRGQKFQHVSVANNKFLNFPIVTQQIILTTLF